MFSLKSSENEKINSFHLLTPQTVSEITAYIALGSNLGDRLNHLQSAIANLSAHPQINPVAKSKIYETDPVGGPSGQGAFLNAVIEVTTTLNARELLKFMLATERLHGRARIEHWGPRTIDLDLLLFGTEQIDEPGLEVPHPRIAERNFVLAPFADLAPALIIPGHTQTIAELLAIAGQHGIAETTLII